MRVTGNKIREAIALWQLRRDGAEKAFKESLYAFPSESESDAKRPHSASISLESCEDTIAELQAAQAQFNLACTVFINAEYGTQTLAFAVRALPGTERMATLWREIATGGDQSGRRYSYGEINTDRIHKRDEEYAQPTVSRSEAVSAATRFKRIANDLRAAIAKGNATEQDVSAEASLFE